jgi:hypothetical protein
MSDVSNAPDTGGGEAIAVVTPAETTGNSLSISQAARALQSARFPKKTEAAPESAESATEQPEQDSAQADDAQPERADPVETTEKAEPEETPLIEPPRSWTKEAKERWAILASRNAGISLRSANRIESGNSAVVKTRPLKRSKA